MICFTVERECGCGCLIQVFIFVLYCKQNLCNYCSASDKAEYGPLKEMGVYLPKHRAKAAIGDFNPYADGG